MKSRADGPRTRPPIQRLLQLRELLRRGADSAVAMAERLEVNERTIRRDLEFARERLQWPVEYDARRRAWRLTGDLPHLPVLSLCEAELMAVLVAGRALEVYGGTPYAEPLRAGFEKLLAALDGTLGVASLSPDALPVFELDPTREVAPDLYGQLHSACRERRRLELTYRTVSRQGEVNVRQVDPYQLLCHAGDWYLIGFCHLRGKVLDFAVGDRMLRVQETGDGFAPDPEFDLEEYLRSGFSVFRGGTVERVALQFSPAQAPYLRERCWAADEEKEELADGGLVLRFSAPVNVGLRRWVLAYGAEVEVLEPEGLREQVAEELRRAIGAYQSASS